MSFYASVGYKFPLPNNATADGSIILGSAMPMHQLLRRRRAHHPHMERLVFDPQLYMATLTVQQAQKQCLRLASYPWFGVELPAYDSSQYSQKVWMANAEAQISTLWRAKPPSADHAVNKAVEEAIDFQVQLGCEAIILPSPLTADPASSYDTELDWLDRGVAYCRSEHIGLPVYATIALADLCIRYVDPTSNPLLDTIIDAVSARGVNGVYIVVEQGGEPPDSRQCATKRTVWSALHMAHLMRIDCRIVPLANFFGGAGLLVSAASGGTWASGWYKSLYRLRFADLAQGGRAYPMFWTHSCASDIHLEHDFDRIVAAGLLGLISDNTTASHGLLAAAAQGVPVAGIPPWRFQQSNVETAAEHFYMSSLAAEQQLATLSSLQGRLDHVENWLTSAVLSCQRLAVAMGQGSKTRMSHVSAWHDALRAHRTTHQV